MELGHDTVHVETSGGAIAVHMAYAVPGSGSISAADPITGQVTFSVSDDTFLRTGSNNGPLNATLPVVVTAPRVVLHPSVITDRPSYAPGDGLTVYGREFPPYSNVFLSWASSTTTLSQLGIVTTKDSGVFQYGFNLPRSLGPGNYIIVAADRSGGPDAQVLALTMFTVAPPVAISPKAHFSMTAQGKTATDGKSLSLTLPINGNIDVSFASTSTQGGAAISTYAWKSNGSTICSNASACTFNFGTASNVISLIVADSNDQTSSATGQINISFQSAPTAHFSMSAQGKSAIDGSTLSLSVAANGNVDISLASTSIQAGAAITSYAWKGNGAPICSNSTSCVFNVREANNTVALTVTDSNGLSSTATGIVALANGPAAAPPHINNVSPNPVTGSNSVQTIAINGTGFANPPKVL